MNAKACLRTQREQFDGVLHGRQLRHLDVWRRPMCQRGPQSVLYLTTVPHTQEGNLQLYAGRPNLQQRNVQDEHTPDRGKSHQRVA